VVERFLHLGEGDAGDCVVGVGVVVGEVEGFNDGGFEIVVDGEGGGLGP